MNIMMLLSRYSSKSGLNSLIFLLLSNKYINIYKYIYIILNIVYHHLLLLLIIIINVDYLAV
uniref:Uncharacterized protein n=1 Tax=Cannabis sativa TaxID=3483 RepID=A0A803R8V2_CANSA